MKQVFIVRVTFVVLYVRNLAIVRVDIVET